MSKMYPEAVGPRSETQLMAWLFGALASAYSMLDQYEQQEIKREQEAMRDSLDEFAKEKKR